MSATSAPIRIGYCLSLTGPVADNSRSARLAHDIWREDINDRGGLLGRLIELICYDDHADASRVPGIYKRLMDEDRVDLVVGGYGTNSLLPAMRLIMERQRFFVGLMGLGVNNLLAYPNYFAMIPTGPDPNAALTEGFFALAAEQRPKAGNGGSRISGRRILPQSGSRREGECREVRLPDRPRGHLSADDRRFRACHRRCRRKRLRSVVSLLLPR